LNFESLFEKGWDYLNDLTKNILAIATQYLSPPDYPFHACKEPHHQLILGGSSQLITLCAAPLQKHPVTDQDSVNNYSFY